MNLETISDEVGVLAGKAGELLAEEAGRWNEIRVEKKSGGDNPGTQVVTEVDRRLEEMLKEGLQSLELKGSVGWLGEESGDDGSRLKNEYFWCVDPLDGTQAFVEGLPGISISIALVTQGGRPVLGVVFDPIGGNLYQSYENGGCWKNGKKVRVQHEGQPIVPWDATWKRHPQGPLLRARLEEMGWSVRDVSGGAVMNVVSILEGVRGSYFKFPKKVLGGGSLWDFSATDCLMREAGGLVGDIEGEPLCLNPADTTFMNTSGVLYATDATLKRDVEALWCELGEISS